MTNYPQEPKKKDNQEAFSAGGLRFERCFTRPFRKGYKPVPAGVHTKVSLATSRLPLAGYTTTAASTSKALPLDSLTMYHGLYKD